MSYSPRIEPSLANELFNRWDRGYWLQDLRVIFGRVILDIDVDVYDDKDDDRYDGDNDDVDENDDDACHSTISP